ncbi:hypothetical protein CDD81_5845 [Ophiocordyceps australis]|uniref:Uncharacterized protein n=1 Tax=Ophiocordyceps australis TaxID=1399860 RepID=A0A2C5Y6Y7_9HYPO|nr:hypothetical protein CDD81_5845 [Ophiocordyceps australis]
MAALNGLAMAQDPPNPEAVAQEPPKPEAGAQQPPKPEEGVKTAVEDKADVDDPCHISGNYQCFKSSEPIPPCTAEQLIAQRCEAILKEAKDEEHWKAYKNCTTGPDSTYKSDIMGCLKCKLDNKLHSEDENGRWIKDWNQALDAFDKEEVPTKTPYDHVQELQQEAAPPTTERVKSQVPQKPLDFVAVPMEQYLDQLPTLQGCGIYFLGGKQFPLIGDEPDAGKPPVEGPQQAIEPEGRLEEAKVKENETNADEANKPAPAAVPTTLLRAPIASKNQTATQTALEPQETGGVSNTFVSLVYYRKCVNVVLFSTSVNCSYTFIRDKPALVEDIPPQKIDEKKAETLPDATECNACKSQSVNLDKIKQNEVAKPEPASEPLAQQVIEKVTTSKVVIIQEIQEVVNMVVGQASGTPSGQDKTQPPASGSDGSGSGSQPKPAPGPGPAPGPAPGPEGSGSGTEPKPAPGPGPAPGPAPGPEGSGSEGSGSDGSGSGTQPKPAPGPGPSPGPAPGPEPKIDATTPGPAPAPGPQGSQGQCPCSAGQPKAPEPESPEPKAPEPQAPEPPKPEEKSPESVVEPPEPIKAC